MDNLAFAIYPRHWRDVLAFAGHFGVFWVVPLHVAAAAAAGGVDIGFDGWGDEVLFGVVDGGADIAWCFS